MKKARTVRWITLVVAIVALYFAGQAVWDWAKEIYCDNQPRPTEYPSSAQPDDICLTWSSDPATTQTIQWRTSPSVMGGIVEYHQQSAPESALSDAPAVRTQIKDPEVTNDPVNEHYTATLGGLQPATTYTYRVGSRDNDTWSDWHQFTTAPAGTEPFSFVYLGDAQIGLGSWGELIDQAAERNPNAAFYLIAGDLVDRGHYRSQWDEFFHAGRTVFSRYPVVPTVGNHDFPDWDSETFFYPEVFALPQDASTGVPQEEAYTLRYSNALFIILNSNRSPEKQRDWLEKQLRNTDATWKFVLYHHPFYSAKKHRNNSDLQKAWGDLFDKYHVDVAFQGHDHSYLRTQPMRANKPVASPAEGTVYLISVSGTKYYDLDAPPFAAKAIADTSTYQVIDISTAPSNTLTYKAYTMDGSVVDEFSIDKGPAGSTAQ